MDRIPIMAQRNTDTSLDIIMAAFHQRPSLVQTGLHRPSSPLMLLPWLWSFPSGCRSMEPTTSRPNGDACTGEPFCCRLWSHLQ